METDLQLDINVPINLYDHEIQQFIRDGNIDGAYLEAEGEGSWTWDEFQGIEFNPDAMDVSEEILKS
tara:strand:- start:297 stop:497 length:201 start_codon:yes stop_codon:yes gene_type:complete